MKAFKVVIGYIQIENDHGEVDNFPITIANVVVDNKATAKYLVKELGITSYELIPLTEAPIYLEHELN